MTENYVQTVRLSVPDGCSEISQTLQLPNNPLTSAIKHLNKLTSSFNNLINDEDGQRMFEEYTKLNKIDDYLLFWFAIEGFKRRYNELDAKRKCNQIYFQSEITNMAKAIYNKFIKKNAKSRVYEWFEKSTREAIYFKIVNNKLNPNIFDDVKREYETKIQDEIFPKFLKSELFLKYSDNLKNHFDDARAIKNPYHQSYSNYHPTSAQESECQFILHREDGDENRNLINLSSKNNVERQHHSNNLITNQSNNQSLNHPINRPIVNPKDQNLNNQLFDQQARNLQDSTGVKSHSTTLPYKPEEDMEKVKSFIAKLEKLYQDSKVLSVIEKFEQDGRNSWLRKFIKRDLIMPVEDSQSILDQHCSRVFSSNYHTEGHNSPGQLTSNGSHGLNTPKKVLKSNTQLENRQNSSKQLKLDLLFNNQANQPRTMNNYLTSTNSSNGSRISNRIIGNSITIIYQYPDDIPYSIKTDTTPITLRRFKKEIIKRPIGCNHKYRYFFKKKDQLENMYVMEELIDDNEYVPFCDGKVFAKIEIVSNQK